MYENFECLVINNNAKTNKLTEQIFGIKQKIIHHLNLVLKNLEISKGMNSDDEDEIYDPNSSRKKGAGPKISVRKSRW